jgi:prepilin signal peptidase PulO-like enzyme (type II secretory pathway)
MPPILFISLFVAGAILGAAANFLIYRLETRPRAIGPWMKPSPKAPPRQWSDYIPIFGWLGLRREAAIHGPGFWIRPLAVELLMGVGVAALYHYEVILGGLLPVDFRRPFTPAIVEMLRCQFAAHVVLFFWMTVASLMDIDETIIPDTITIPGLLTGLAIAALLPQSHLPQAFLPAQSQLGKPDAWEIGNLSFTSHFTWPLSLNAPFSLGLVIGLLCWLFVCYAYLPLLWYAPRGRIHALRLCIAYVCRQWFSLAVLAAFVVGSAIIAAFWHLGGPRWISLLSALVGMAFAMGITWAIRIIGTATIKMEAMGFGDVTLMAAIGAFLGWQASLILFFIAPFAALVFALLRFILTRNHEIYYGPFLCFGAVVTILGWDTLWGCTEQYFLAGWLVPVVLAICGLMMPILLFGVRLITRRFDSEK